MKKLIIGLILVMLSTITFCQSKTSIEAEKATVADLFDKYYSAINANDAATLSSLITENALVCGTDPSEFWNKEEITELWSQSLADTTFKANITVNKREIRVAEDGNSAVVVEQYILPFLSSKIPIRNVSYAVKTNEKWKIDFMSFNFIPKNEDISKLNKALE